MDELVQQLVQRVGLSESQAQQVVDFLKANASKIPDQSGSAEARRSRA